MVKENEFQGEIVVASRIIDYLSSGLYESPAACLKELINNSFDADATRVDIFVKPDADRIIIEDNGSGMDQADFVKHFSKISESHKRDDSDYTPSGRPKIGKIGIGFIAANEICDVMEIVSTKTGSTELLEVSIHFDLMRQDIHVRKRSDTEIAKADYYGSVSETDLDSHFTQVFLKKVRGEAKSILSGAGPSEFAFGDRSLYGLKPESVNERLRDNKLRTWSQFDAYSRNALEVALNVPVRYHDRWLPSKLRSQVKHFEQHVANLDFSAYFDGSELRKPIVFNPESKALIDRFEFEGKHVAAEGYFYAQHGTIKPQELQGLLIRIRNAAIGGYDSSFLGFSLSHGTLFQNWISGEIMADDRLEDAMNIDRRTLRVAHPAYVELQVEVHKYMENLIKRVRDEIYGTGSKTRKTERAKAVEKRIISIATQEITKVAPAAAKQVQRLWTNATDDESGQKKLLRKFTVDELYSLVIEVAEEVLSPEQLNDFLVRLTERLRG
jgi:vacuolar-type H+-ATPase subunit H